MKEKTKCRPGSVAKFGQYVRQERLSRRLVQSHVAKRVGVTPAYLCRVELGDVDTPPNSAFVIKLAEAMGIDPVEMLVKSGRDDNATVARQIKESRRKS